MSIRKTVFALLVGAVLLNPRFASAAPEPGPLLTASFTRLKAGEKLKLVTFGTSLTKYGYWVTAMTEWFQAQYPNQVTVVNNGGPGQNSNWGRNSVKQMVLTQNPDIVFVEFSYNDAHTKFKMPVETGKDNLDKIVTAIQEQNPKAAIILQTMNAPWDRAPATSLTDRPQLEAFNDNYRSYAKDPSLPLVDNYPGFLEILNKEPERYHKIVPDGSHPNKDGSLAVTWPNVKALLESAQAAAK